MKHPKKGPTNPLLPRPDEYCTASDSPKRKYTSEIEAELFAPVTGLQQYVCTHCGFWHNGGPQQESSLTDAEQGRTR